MYDTSGTCLAPTEAERRKDCENAKHGTIRRYYKLISFDINTILFKSTIWRKQYEKI